MLHLYAARANFCTRSLSSNILHARRFYFPNSAVALGRWPVHSASTQKNHFSVLKAIGAVGLGLGISIFTRPKVHCEGSRPISPTPIVAPPQAPDAELPPPPPSAVNMYELTFGTVAGLCAGVFIKKGAKAVAFFLGGVFVLLQYFGSFGVLKVDWESMGGRFQRLFYTTDPKTGSKATPTIYSLWRWMVDFLTADFQPRASFVAGLALGLRIG
ncbi:FUN14 family-domain-containing protein [Mycena alexandri]|uniref:FUN14 family-domain-containing protein n=1 Tax=Mycena alexandri TaxID=1745969 RepID=A0AAD6TJW4_9AGAR|nr:FUN14 family-domain-containing protein [Mycena alexandri]